MPEGPEVRTLVDQLQGGVGKRLVNMQFVSGRYTNNGKPRGFEEFRKTMTSHIADDTTGIDIVTDTNCKGKFIWMSLDQGKIKDDMDIDKDDYHRSIWITLGMSGRFVRDTFNVEKEDDGTSHKQPRWYFEFVDELLMNPDKKSKKVFYYDTRNFGTLRFSLSKKELMDKLQSLGPDILQDITEDQFMAVFRKQRQTMNICKFLMNQSKISGVGNYLLSEALYRAGLDPFASLDEISDEQASHLYREVVDTARESYDAKARRGESYRDIDGNEVQYTFSLQCYGREYCPKGKEIIRETDGPHGRTIWYVEDQLFMPRSKREIDINSKEVVSKTKQTMKSSVEHSFSQREDANLTLSEALEDQSWKEALAPFLGSEKFDRLTRFVESQRRLHTVYPLSQDVFSAFNMCRFDQIKVVIIGQDPYHGPGQGHGLAFSVQQGVKPPPSLKNIFKELEADEGIDIPIHGNLEKWAKQGVLLLNTVLTVRQGEANSHSKMGWEDLSDEVVEVLNERREGLVFLLWGAPAGKKGRAVDKSKHTVITTSHPSPLGALKTNSPFLVSSIAAFCISNYQSCLLNAFYVHRGAGALAGATEPF